MKSLMLVFALGTAALTATPMAHALQETAEAPSARVLNDIAYYDGADADPERHALNLVLPAEGAARAAVLWRHLLEPQTEEDFVAVMRHWAQLFDRAT